MIPPQEAGPQVVHGTHTFAVGDRYVLREVVGQGAQGIICAAEDRLAPADDNTVAIKKVSSVLEDKTAAKRLLREVQLLRHFNHENIIRLRDLRVHGSDVYLVSELMDCDLHFVLSSGQPLSDEHAQYFLFQLLLGLQHMHAAGVAHRDLKPNNLLVNKDCELRICDFGLARHLAAQEAGAPAGSGADEPSLLTLYVTTRWYRAPELLCLNETYSAAVDMWSVGCILAEVLSRRPLFPGRDYLDQIRLIVGTLGTPSAQELGTLHNQRAAQYVQGLPPSPGADLAALFPSSNPAALDLLGRLLQFDPARRCTAAEALRHPYLSAYHDEEADSVDAQANADAAGRLFEQGASGSLEALRERILAEAQHFGAQPRAQRG